MSTKVNNAATTGTVDGTAAPGGQTTIAATGNANARVAKVTGAAPVSDVAVVGSGTVDADHPIIPNRAQMAALAGKTPPSTAAQAPPGTPNATNTPNAGTTAQTDAAKAVQEAEDKKKRQELQDQIQAEQKQLDEALEKGKKTGDFSEADRLMSQIQADVKQLQALGGPVGQNGKPPQTLAPGGVAPSPSIGGPMAPVGNMPFFGGDAPMMYPGINGGPAITGGNAMSAGDIGRIAGQLPPAGPRTGVVNTALDIAKQGLPYVWGGNGNPGYDCSGFTTAVFAKNGINLPRTAQGQYNYCAQQGSLQTGHGTSLLKDAKPGDLLFFDNNYGAKSSPIGHVMMYLGKDANGQDMMVGAQSRGVSVYPVSQMSNYLVGVGRPDPNKAA